MRVVGYVRVSLAKQAEDGISLEAQRAKIAAYCVVKDWTLAEVVTDEGESAKDLNRPGMQSILANLKDIDVVIVTKLDRLTRSVADMADLLGRFARAHTSLVSLNESLDATTATGELMINLLVSVSQWERKVIGERTSAVMQHMKASGQVYCRERFLDDAIINDMRAMKGNGLSYAAIADSLTARGISTARGGAWTACTVRKIMLNS